MSSPDLPTPPLGVCTPPWRRWATWVLATGGLLLAAASLAGRAGSFAWILELASHWRVQYLIGFLVVTAGCAVLRSWRWALIFLVFALAEAVLVLPLYIPPDRPEAVGRSWRLLSINTWADVDNGDRIAALVRETDPDMVLLLEVNTDLLERIEELRADYPHGIVRPESLSHGYRDAFGLAFLSRVPLKAADFIFPGGTGVPAVEVVMDLDGREVRLVGIHTYPPRIPYWARLRNRQMEDLARRFRAAEGHGMLCGDLNLTPWSPWFSRALRESGLRDSTRGFGLQPTWPARKPYMWIPLDHCLVTPGIRVTDRRVGPDIGSDHLPLLLEFSVASGREE